MKTVNASEFKARALQIMSEVSGTGEAVLVTKRGKPLVTVAPVPNPKSLKLGHFAGSLIEVGDIVAPVFDDWDPKLPESPQPD